MDVDWIALQRDPLEIAAAVAFVTSPDAGAIATFLGTTRAERNPSARRLLALDYEAYGEMADKQMRGLSDRVRQRWPVARLVLWHRVGRVEVGQPSVLIAVSTPHRAEAFEACRWLIDTLKAEVTIWKKEIWHDGTEIWVGQAGDLIPCVRPGLVTDSVPLP